MSSGDIDGQDGQVVEKKTGEIGSDECATGTLIERKERNKTTWSMRSHGLQIN